MVPEVKLALHLYQSPMDNESRLIRMARSIAAITPDVQVRLVGMQVDERSGLQPLEPGVVVDRVGDATPKKDTLTSRFQKVGGWFREVYKAYRTEALAVVAAHAVWALPVAWSLARHARVPLVYNPHELETRTPTMVGVKRLLAEQIEARFIHRCSLVSVVNDEIADWYADRYRIERPLVVCNFPSERAQGPARPLREEFDLNDDELLFVHTGHLIAGRNIPLILEEFERSAKHHVLFVGGGDLEPRVLEAVGRSRFIHHLPPVPPDEVVSVVKGADFALSLIETTAQSYAWSSPNKLFEALSAGTPPVCSDLPEARRRVGGEAPELILKDPASQLRQLLDTIDRVAALNIRRSLKSLPTWEEGVQPLVSAYRVLLNQ